MDEIEEKRWANLFQFATPKLFGALYWVDEDVWKERLGSKYDQTSNRVCHPGCSITRLHSTLGPINMLHGTSNKSNDKKKDEIPVKDVDGFNDIDGAKHKITWFGGLDSIPMEFVLLRQRKISPAVKGRVDELELKDLAALCGRRGW